MATSAGVKKNNETTLTHLTKRFVKLLNSSSERVINLNEASTRLSVAKRRIYDITNVLEGIGLLQKTSKNVTRWVDCPRDSPFAAKQNATSPNNILPPQINYQQTTTTLSGSNHNNNSTTKPPQTTDTTGGAVKQQNSDLTDEQQLDDLAYKKFLKSLNIQAKPDAELEDLLKTYQALEDGVNSLEHSIRQQLGADGAYVTWHDINSSFNDQIVIAVKAPPETRLEVNENLQISIKSENGKIEVYLYQQNSDKNNNINNTNNPQQLQLQQTGHSINTSQPQPYTSASSDEGRGKSIMSTTDGVYYDHTSGVSNEDHYYTNDPTLSSALSGTISEDDDPFRTLVPFEGREEAHYNFVLDDNCPISSLFPEDNLSQYL